MDDEQSSWPPRGTSGPAIPLIIFMNGLALGIVCPLFFFLAPLPGPIWVALLIAFDSVGRIAGGLALPRLRRRLGVRWTIVASQAIFALSFAVLASAGRFQGPGSAALAIVYFSRFLGAFATADFPSVRFLFQRMNGDGPRVGATRAGLIAMIGLATGCAIRAALGTSQVATPSAFITGGLTRPAEIAAAVSTLAILIALRRSTSSRLRRRTRLDEPRPSGSGCTDTKSNDASQTSSSWSAATPAIVLAAEAAFGMTLCVLPLMQRESFAFTPAKVAAFLAYTIAVSAGVRVVALRWIDSLNRSLPVLINLGLLLATLGFLGFVGTCWVSGVTQPFNGIVAGMWLLWVAGTVAAIAQALLQGATQWFVMRSNVASLHAFSRFDGFSGAVTAVSAFVAAALWVDHERTSFAIPCVLTAAALTFGATKLPAALYETRTTRAKSVLNQS